MSNIDLVLSVLEKVKPRGQDKWLACCPAHDDKDPSLSIALVDDRVLLKCWSGCGGVEVMEATGLPMTAFAPEGVLGRSEDKIRSVFGQKPRQADTKPLDYWRVETAKADRAAGKRLTEGEKKLELEAMLRIKRGCPQ
jgi:hypothetical protein